MLVLDFCVFPRLHYATETITTEAANSRQLLAFEKRCYMRILKLCQKDKVSNNH